MGANIIFKYFAVIGALSGLINAYMTYRRIKKMNQDHNDIATNDEIEEFMKWYGVCFTVPFVCVQVFQLLGNYRTVFYIFLLDFDNPFYTLGFLSMVLFDVLLFYLIIIKDGAAFMAKYSKAFGNLPSDKQKIKKFFALLILVSLIVLLLGNRFMGGAFTAIEETRLIQQVI